MCECIRTHAQYDITRYDIVCSCAAIRCYPFLKLRSCAAIRMRRSSAPHVLAAPPPSAQSARQLHSGPVEEALLMLLLLRLQRCAALMSVVASCLCCHGAAVAVAADVCLFVSCSSLRLAPQMLAAPPGALVPWCMHWRPLAQLLAAPPWSTLQPRRFALH